MSERLFDKEASAEGGSRYRTDVAIVGAGPAGLMLAIELGCRGVACVVLEEDADVAVPPKANATSARTMEHFRRRGFADAVRAVGLPDGDQQDVVYCTRLAGHELARFRIPAPARPGNRRRFGHADEGHWPTPELPHRGNQMFIEPVLRAQARSHASVTLAFSIRVNAVRDLGERVELEAVDTTPAGGRVRIEARFAVGCEGARSVVREAIGASYLGLNGEKRDFFGGLMLGLQFRAPTLYATLGGRGWMWWLFNPEQRGVLVALDGVDRFIFGIQLKPGQSPNDVDATALFAMISLAPFEFELLDRSTWSAGHMLVADRFRSGRLFIAGDAAHLFTPTGGMGYNTSVDDAVNLGWKLAAEMQGWAGPALLASYEDERRPIAERNTAFARAMADSIGSLPIPPRIEEAGPAGDAERGAFGERLFAHAESEFDIPGVQLGLRYAGSIVAADSAKPPPDDRNHYVPSGHPGARAPHLELADGGSILDRLGRDFTLLAFASFDEGRWRTAASSLAIPLLPLPWPDVATLAAARALYGADLILIRPDHHVAWRGDCADDVDPAKVLARASGWARAPVLQGATP